MIATDDTLLNPATPGLARRRRRYGEGRWRNAGRAPGATRRTTRAVITSAPTPSHAILRDRKLARYRAALEAGTDPTIVADWIQQVQAERTAVESRAKLRPAPRQRMSREQIKHIATTLTDLAAMIENADARDKAEITRSAALTKWILLSTRLGRTEPHRRDRRADRDRAGGTASAGHAGWVVALAGRISVTDARDIVEHCVLQCRAWSE
jgi:hypothetical protein